MKNEMSLDQRMKRAACLNFGLFSIFFIFYVGAAVLQTPAFKSVAEISLAGMPIGLLISLSVFPVSWLILILWFRRSV